jgi:tetratricopeptide (TPR) repeat protein
MRWLLAGVMVCAAATAASGAVTVLGNGIARSCYEAAKFGITPKDGVKVCTTALQNEPLNVRDRAATYTNRGILRLRLQQAEIALADFNKAVSLKPDLGQTYINRSAALVQLKRHQEAVDDASKALELSTDDAHAAYFNRAMAYESMGNLEAAYNDLQAALVAKPDFADAHRELQRYSVKRVSG